VNRLTHVVLTLAVVPTLFAIPARATSSFFDIFTDIASVGPPYAMQDQGIGRMNAGTFAMDLLQHTTLQSIIANDEGGTQPPCHVISLNGLPPGTPWTESFFDVFFDIDRANGNPWPVDSFFDIFYELDIPGGGPSQLTPLHPELSASDPERFFEVTYFDSFFDIMYQVEVGPGGGCDVLHVHGETQPGLHFRSLTIEHQPGIDSFFDVFVELEAQPGPVQIDPNLPMLKTTTSGEFVTGPLGAQATTWGKIKSLYSSP
jgi:hypothetical protein